MNEQIIKRLTELTEEERGLLSGESINTSAYFAQSSATVNAEGLFGPYEIGIRRHTRFAEFPRHKHGYLEAMIVLSGRVVHDISGERITLGQGDILFLNKHISHAIMKTELSDIAVNISLTNTFLSGAASGMSGTAFLPLLTENAKESGEGRFLHFSCEGDIAAENLMENIILELLGGARDSVAAKYVEVLMQYLAREGERLLRAGVGATDKRAERMRAVSEYIKSSLAVATLNEISSRLFLCPPYLSKLIKEYFGKSFKELLVDEKLSRAERLVVKTDMNVGDIIRSVGYDNESYFHKEFKKRYGQTPLALRRMARKNDENKN